MVLYGFMQGSWGCIQNLVGLIMFLYLRRKNPTWKWERFKGAFVLHWTRNDSVAIGRFIFFGHQGANEERMLRHEYGHTIQSAVLGPAYLLLIGIPSYIWANYPSIAKKWRSGESSYFSFYTEKWADAWGKVHEITDYTEI